MKNLLKKIIFVIAIANAFYSSIATAVPTNPIKSSQVGGNGYGYYYKVTCSAPPIANGLSATFHKNQAGTCYSYTNGKQTYETPMTCYPEFRDPTLEEFNALIGRVFCSTRLD
jgi:hypothetical protein